jgi:hypothetical protein
MKNEADSIKQFPGKAEPFEVPDAFFDDSREKILAAIDSHQKPGRKRSMIIAMAVAASVLGFLLVSTLVSKTSAPDDSQVYLEYLLAQFDVFAPNDIDFAELTDTDLFPPELIAADPFPDTTLTKDFPSKEEVIEYLLQDELSLF